MSDLLEPVPLPEGLDISAEDWQQTPVSVRLVMRTLLQRLEALESRVHQDSSNSSRPPSTDTLSTKRQRRTKAAERRKAGAKPGHLGHSQVLLEPTATVALFPETCACGQSGFAALRPYHTHQVIELPVIRPEVTHWMLHQGWCLSCGKLCKAPIPAEHGSGYGPRGLDHGVGHSLLLPYDIKAPNGQKSNEFKGLGHYPSDASLSAF